MKFIIITLSLFFFVSVHSQVHEKTGNHLKKELALSKSSLAKNMSGSETENQFLVKISDGFSPEQIRSELENAGAVPGSIFGNLITVTCKKSSIQTLADLPFVEFIESEPGDMPLMNVSRSKQMNGSTFRGTWTDTVHTLGYTGKRVIVGIVDDGFSFSHGDFQKPDGTSRVLFIWNQGTNTPAKYPALPVYSYGTEWTSANIDASQVTGVPTNSHGSNCLSISCSDGSASGIKGMAPESDIILVVRKSGSTLANTIDAFNYIQKKAKSLGKPVVISYSLGSQFGPHDGTKVHEIAIDSLSGPGSIFAIAAGNSGGQNIHITGNLPATGFTDTLRFTISSNPNGNGQSFSVNSWYPSGDSLDFSLIGPTGNVYGPFSLKASFDTLSTSDGFLYIGNNFDAISQRNIIDWELINFNNRKVKTGQWKAVHYSRKNNSGSIFDGWINISSVSGSFQDHVNSQKVITMPGTAVQAVTAGAYEISTGSRQSGSSIGPTRDGRQKPELSAPSNVTTAFGVFGGTSASAPHLTGAIALLLQADSSLTPTQIKDLLQNGANVDAVTGSVPNASWGFGKLNSYEAIAPLLIPDTPLPVSILSFSGKFENGFSVFGWKTTNELNVAGYEIEVSTREESWQLLGSYKFLDEMRYETGNLYTVSIPFHAIRDQTYQFRIFCVDLDGTRSVAGLVSFAFSEENPTYLPKILSVSELYPNPANPGSVFHITADKDQTIAIEIFNISGQLVQNLPGLRLKSGESKTVNLSAETLSTGVYLIRISGHSKLFTRKLVVLK
ncbi:MAG: S8 family peptidase [Bacteroidetes bacterium]|nr:S8 family peptidase [Bacteroidota bacterium]